MSGNRITIHEPDEWFIDSETNTINWLLCVYATAQEIDSSDIWSTKAASIVRVWAASER